MYYINFYDTFNNGYNSTLGGKLGTRNLKLPKSKQLEVCELYQEGFSLRTIANEYNDVLYELISKAKTDGKKRVVLYGKSYIRFLLVYVCTTVGIEFVEKDIGSDFEEESFCLYFRGCIMCEHPLIKVSSGINRLFVPFLQMRR